MIEKNVEGAITSEDVLGKDVIDSKGAILGVSDKLYLHPKTLTVIGISVDKGFMRKGFLIGAGHIREVTSYAVFLTIQPTFRLKGMTVFGDDGEKIGIVQSVTLVANSNAIENLEVKTSKGVITIPPEYLGRMEDNVFLNVSSEKVLT